MIKKLRRHIIIVNMVLVGIVILAICAAITVNSYTSSLEYIEHGLNTVVERGGKFGGEKNFPLMKIGNTSDEARMEFDRHNAVTISSYVRVSVSKSGEITNIEENNVSIDEDVVTDCVSEILKAKKPGGKLNKYELIYTIKEFPETIEIALADTGIALSTLNNTLLICAALFAGSLVIVFLISLALSGFAVKPIKKAWEQQKQFVADASHELKTPLTVILANNNIMMSHSDSKISDERQWLESTEEEAQHMKKLIDQMLFLAKSDAGTNKIELSSVNLSELVEAASLIFEPVAFEKEILLDTMIDSDIIIDGNSMQLNQLAHILIDNAVKYGDKSSVVTIKLKRKNDIAQFSVNNTGSIIPPEDIEHIFDRFYRAEKSRTTKGYGLGLAIAKNIVESMNGKLSVTSNKESGTTFTVIFGC